MAATTSFTPAEEVALVVLGKDLPKDEAYQSYPQEQSSEDPEATLRWSDACYSSACETEELKVSKSDMRPSPEGSREDAKGQPVVNEEVFPKALTTKEADGNSNEMPEVATRVFVPIDPHCVERPPTGDEKKRKPQEYEDEIVLCEKEKGDSEKQNFITRGYSAHFDDLPSCDGERSKSFSEGLKCLQCCNCNSINLKAVASMIAAAIIFPCLLYGAYVFLPFDVPLMPSMSTRLVYTLRCGVFATFPIIVGMVVYGISRLCFSSLQPFGELRREVEIHRHYVSQSVHLFILYFFNIAVLSTYLPQEGLKLIPLLTALFAISRLIYWLAYAMGRSFRGFGFGLTFLPLVAMLLFNLYSMFLVDPENMFAMENSSTEKDKQSEASKRSFWG